MEERTEKEEKREKERREDRERRKERKRRRCVIALSAICLSVFSLHNQPRRHRCSIRLLLLPSVPPSPSSSLLFSPSSVHVGHEETRRSGAVQCSAVQCRRHLQIYLKSLLPPSLPSPPLLFHSLLSSVDLSIHLSIHLSFSHAIYKCHL